MKRVPVPDKHKRIDHPAYEGHVNHPAYKGWQATERYSYPSARIMLKGLFFYICRQGEKQ